MFENGGESDRRYWQVALADRRIDYYSSLQQMQLPGWHDQPRNGLSGGFGSSGSRNVAYCRATVCPGTYSDLDPMPGRFRNFAAVTHIRHLPATGPQYRGYWRRLNEK